MAAHPVSSGGSMVRRHQLRLVGALGLALALPWIASRPAGAAAPDKTVRVGLLLSGFEPSYVQAERAFLAGMRDIGYEEGRNLVVERRYAHLEPDRMRSAAAELAQMKLDAIVTGCTGSTRAMQRATQATPIVMASVADPVGQGFVKRLARSETNVTGRSSQSLDLLPKMLELFTTAVPGATRIAVLVNVLNTVHETLWAQTMAASASRHIDLVRVDVRGPDGLDAAFETLTQSRAHALLVLPDDPMSYNLRARILAFASLRGLPTFFGFREFVDAGGLMSYGEKFADTYRHTAPYVQQVVRGANPAELPIEQPTRFELVINLRTAAALGIVFPQSVLLRADATIK
jgi:putative ABC transport system substrate-binding protein